MTQRRNGQDAQVQRILDRLKVTPEQLHHFHENVARDAVATVDRIEWDLVRPSKTRWPFTGLWRINLDTFDQHMRAALDPLNVGYCYVLKRRGKLIHLRSSGWAQLSNDGNVAWRLDIPMNVASVSKFVTATATVRLLQDSKIPLTTPIAGYLPKYWTTGPGVGAITFHDLLRHESGLGAKLNVGGVFNTGPGDFATAKDQIQTGSSGTGTYDYKNVNFAVMRVLFATLTGLDPTVSLVFAGISDDTFWDLASAMAYSNYVNDTVFAAADIAPREFAAEGNAAKAYATPPKAPGARIVDGAGGSGTSGWHLSIGELVRLLDEFRAGSMMPRWRAVRLLSAMYGLDAPLATKAGPVYRKGGRKLDGQQGMDSAIYLMPGDMAFAIFVNAIPRPPATSPPPGTPSRPRPSHLDAIPRLILNSIEFIF